ncbi:MAG: peptidoglycan-binding protein [Clostridia bacterium]|nr:peptidoglycan-binding protein [Clostridia bacterium]
MKRAQKLISIILMVTMLLGVIGIFPASVTAASAIDIKAALDAKMQSSTFKPGNTPPSSQYRSGTSGCYGFVDLLYRQIFGHTLPSIKKVESSVGTQKMELIASANFTQIGTTLSNKAGNLNSSNLSNLFSKAQVGDVVQMDYTTYDNVDSLHTMIVYSVSTSGVVLYHAGSSKIYFGASSGKEPLWGTTGNVLTWSKLLDRLGSSDDGISIYRSNSSSVNIDNNTDSYSSKNPDDYTYPSSTIYRTSPSMKGSTVAWVQAVLYQLGYSIDIDGSYGANSEAVVKQFQNANGLEVDGRVGPATRAKLLELWNKKKHTHSFEVLTETAHPHKVYKSCSCGYKEYTGEYKTVYTCNSCLPEKSVLTILAGTSLDYTSFSWKAAQGADCYELIVYKKGEDKPVQWLYNLTTNQHKLLLSAGDYTAYVASINNDLIDSSCWWVYSDKVEFSVLERETFAPSASAEFNGNKYEIYDVNMSWSEANAKCEELGGHLVTVNNEDEMNAVHQLMSQGQYAMYWLGITDEDQEGVWKDITGKVLVYTNWRAGYPDNDNNVEHYGLILNDGTWGDVSNMYPGEIGFVCEYETEDNTDDGHIHDYYVTDSISSTCTEYGYKVYTCDCGDTYTENVELNEHDLLQMDLGGQSNSCVNFEYEFCQVCKQVVEFSVACPDGSVVDLPLPENTEYPGCHRVLIEKMKDLLVDFDLKANMSTSDEKTIDFSWNAIVVEESTADESIYYVLSIYKGTELIETIKTSTPYCIWKFDSNDYNIVITAFNELGELVAISSIYNMWFVEINADVFYYYGDADLNRSINVKDATIIQKYLANLAELEKYSMKVSDVNSDGKVNIKDATAIQKYCAKIDTESRVGNEFWDSYTDYSGVIVEVAR